MYSADMLFFFFTSKTFNVALTFFRFEPIIVVYTNIQEAEAGSCISVGWGQPALQSKSQDSQSYTQKPCLRNNNNNKTQNKQKPKTNSENQVRFVRLWCLYAFLFECIYSQFHSNIVFYIFLSLVLFACFFCSKTSCFSQDGDSQLCLTVVHVICWGGAASVRYLGLGLYVLGWLCIP